MTSDYEMYKGVKDGKEVFMCIVGKTTLIYDANCLTDLHTMLKQHGDWMELGSADEQKPAKELLKHGDVQKAIQTVVGMDFKKDCVEDLECMSRL